MPGIVGIISKTEPEVNVRDLKTMVRTMTHEDYHKTGIYVEKEMGIYAGWVCHAGSFSDCMPVTNAGRDIILFYTGEDFQDSSVLGSLAGDGVKTDDSDAGYILELYERDKENFFGKLNGWFSGFIVDLKEKTAVLFNDRYPMERIYYSESSTEFIFSSEAKALLKIRPRLREIDLKSLGQFFAWNCVLDNRTLFTDIHLLPGGSKWTFSMGRPVKKKRYFEPGMWEGKPALKEEDFYCRLTETLKKVVPKYFKGPESIAMSMSSGLDTRLILAFAEVQPGELPCHTFGGLRRATLDGILGRKIARSCGQPHEFLHLDEIFLSRFSEYAEQTVYRTDGCHDVLGTHDIFFNRLVREKSPVRMTGKFGSEIVRSQSMLRKPYNFLDGFFHEDFKCYMDSAMETFARTKKGHGMTFAAFKEMPWNEYGRLAIERSVLGMRSPFMDNELVELMYQAPENVRDSDDMVLRLIEDADPGLLKVMTDSGTAGTRSYPFSALTQFWHDGLVKAEYVYLYMLPHWMAAVDKVLSPLRPERLLAGRHQLGYYRLWFRDRFPGFLREVLLDERTLQRPFLNGPFIRDMVLKHTRGAGNFTGEINKALTVELIHRKLVEEI